jgi:hypothetical protein
MTSMIIRASALGAALAALALSGCNNPQPEKTKTAGEMPDTSGKTASPDVAPPESGMRPQNEHEPPSVATTTVVAPANQAAQEKGATPPGTQKTPPQ